ncbi:MAG: hypothetical protein HQK59_00435 [Deltaproteobacteria bacterium]|nr:hypothetical protein [Deltaproteobacteria bacterium]
MLLPYAANVFRLLRSEGYFLLKTDRKKTDEQDARIEALTPYFNLIESKETCYQGNGERQVKAWFHLLEPRRDYTLLPQEKIST